MNFNGTSVGLDVHALSVVAHPFDAETGRVKPAPLCPDHGEILGRLRQLHGPVQVASEAGRRASDYATLGNRHVTGTTRKPVRRWWMRWCATPKPR